MAMPSSKERVWTQTDRLDGVSTEYKRELALMCFCSSSVLMSLCSARHQSTPVTPGYWYVDEKRRPPY